MCVSGSAPDKHCGDTRAHSIDTSIQGRPAAMPKRGRAMAAAALAAAAGWPQPVGQRPRLAEAGSDDGSCAPPERLTATQGVASELFQLKRLPVALSAAAARGPCAVVAERVDPLLLQWLRIPTGPGCSRACWSTASAGNAAPNPKSGRSSCSTRRQASSLCAFRRAHAATRWT